MFQRLLEQRWVIYAVLHDERGSQNQYKHLHLKEEQWNLKMEEIVTVLEPLQIATTALCEAETVSCSLIYPVINGLLKNHLVPGEGDLLTVKRFKEIVTQDIQKRFNLSDAVTQQNTAIFATILDPHYHPLKFMDYSTRTTAYSLFKEKLASCEEECRIVQETVSNSPKRKKKKSAMAILLGEDEEDDSMAFKTSEFENI